MLVNRLESYEKTANGWLLHADTADVLLVFLSDDVIRVRVNFDRKFDEASYTIAFPECETFALACAGCYDGIVEEIKPFFDRHIVRPASHINIGRPWTLRERRQQAKALRRVADIEMRLLPLLEATLNTLQG